MDSAIVNPEKRYIINTSIGIHAPSDSLDVLESAIARADSHNVLLVASTGNTIEPVGRPGEYEVEFPAMFSRLSESRHYCNVISVGAVDTSYYWADYSNYLGPDTCDVYVDLSAPGGSRQQVDALRILTLSSDYADPYKYKYGTSYSSAHVSGAAALVWALNPFLTHHEVKHILKTTAFDPSDPSRWSYSSVATWCYDPEQPEALSSFDPICDDCGGYEYNRYKGTGIVNIYNALNMVKAAYIHGEISTDMTWSGEIRIIGDIIVAPNKTLAIEPGTVIKIATSDYDSGGEDSNKVEILVKGSLRAGLINGGIINIKSERLPNATSRDWIGIVFDSTSTDNALYNVSISNATRAIKNHAPIELRHCTIDASNFTTLDLHDNALIDSSTIYLTCDTRIESGDTLTLSGNSHLWISPVDSNNTLIDPLKVELLCNGRLIVTGTVDAPVAFGSYAANPSPGDWRWLEIAGASASASLSYCNLSFGYHGIKAKRPINLSHCTFSDCSVYGVYLQTGGVNGAQISYCTSSNNGAAGIMLGQCNNVTIDNCEFSSNCYGIDADGVNGLHINHSIMKDNTGDGMEVINSQSYLDLCTIENNNQQGIFMRYSGGMIQNTKIWKNDANGLYCYGASSNPMIDHSKIEQNQVGVRVTVGGCPVLGDTALDSGQYNSIYDQPTYIYGSPNYTIMAEKCWWGTQPGALPDPDKFKGLVDFNPFLQQDHVPNLASHMQAKPALLSLSQNYPNPFKCNGVTTILYSVPTGHATSSLIIYDVAGRRVRTLVGDVQARGRHSVTWDGRTDFGAKAAPGVYFYHLIVNSESISKKLVLFR